MARAPAGLPAGRSAIRFLAMMLGVTTTQSIGLVAQIGIADLLAGGPKTVDELAVATGAHPRALSQVMRALTALEVFAETTRGCYACTPLADLLRTDAPHSLRGYALLMSSEQFARMWARLPHSVRTGRCAFEEAFGTDFYAYLRQAPDFGAIFGEAMTSISRQEAAALRDAYDLSSCRVLVDVGGGRGLLLAMLLQAYPSLRGVLLDLPPVAEGARTLLEAEALHGRYEIVGGSYFEAVPPGGDIYLLKRVLQEHEDEPAREILGRCRAAMADGGRLLVAEPDISTRYGQLFDIFMLAVLGGRLRSEAEMRDLFVGSGLRLTRTIGTRSALRLFEGVPA